MCYGLYIGFTGKQAPSFDPVENSELVLLLEEYEKELAKAVLMKSLWQNCIEAAAIHGIRTGRTHVDRETFK